MKVSTAVFLVVLTFAGSAAAQPPGRPAPGSCPRARLPRAAARRRTDSPCKTGFELLLPGDRLGCTHGPDAAPPGRDVRRERSLARARGLDDRRGHERRRARGRRPLHRRRGHGKARPGRVRLPAGRGDNYDEIAPFIRLWAGVVDEAFNDSAAETGGVRHVRFVTGPDCTLDVAKVELSPDRSLQPRGHGRRSGGAGLRPARPQVPRLGRRLRLLRGRHGQARRPAFPRQRQQRGRRSRAWSRGSIAAAGAA